MSRGLESFFRLLFWLALAVILYLATTSNTIEIIQNVWDKLKHSSAFFVLFILFELAYSEVRGQEKLLYLLLFGVLIEIIQYFLPFREFSLLDVFADLVGLVLARFLLFFYDVRAFFRLKRV